MKCAFCSVINNPPLFTCCANSLQICSRSDKGLTAQSGQMQFLSAEIFFARCFQQNNNVFIFFFLFVCYDNTHIFRIFFHKCECGLLIAMRLYTSLKTQGHRQKMCFYYSVVFVEIAQNFMAS